MDCKHSREVEGRKLKKSIAKLKTFLYNKDSKTNIINLTRRSYAININF